MHNRTRKIPDCVLYLVHTTSRKYKDVNGIVWTEIKTGGNEQYPGAYFSLITTHNRLTEKLFPATDCLIFSRNLLKQDNYHINLCDDSGYITEGNTFFPWNLEAALEKIKENAALPLDESRVNYHRMNEVVFHDSIPIQYLCADIPSKIFSTDFLPNYPIANDVEPNLSLLPFYCFSQSEEKSRYKSSIHFFRKLAECCIPLNSLLELPNENESDGTDSNFHRSNIHISLLSKDEIIAKIIENAPMIHRNRHLQNIDGLVDAFK